MSKFIGRLINVGVARESSRGAGAAPIYQLPKTSFNFDDKVTKARSVASIGRISDSEEAFVTTKYGEGDLEGEIRDKSFGLLLYALLGSLSTSGPTDTSAYTHAFSLANNNQHQSLSFVVEDSNKNELYKLVMLNSLEIIAELDEITMFKAAFMGKCARDTGLTVPAVVTENKFTKKHLRFKVATDIAGLAAATPISLKSLSIKISKNVVLDDVLGTAEPEDILNRQISIEGDIELNYEDDTWKNYMKSDTNKAVEIALINTDVVIGASTNPSLTMQLPKVDFFDWEFSGDNDEITTQKISFKANRDVANGQDLIYLCNLVNAVTSY